MIDNMKQTGDRLINSRIVQAGAAIGLVAMLSSCATPNEAIAEGSLCEGNENTVEYFNAATQELECNLERAERNLSSEASLAAVDETDSQAPEENRSQDTAEADETTNTEINKTSLDQMISDNVYHIDELIILGMQDQVPGRHQWAVGSVERVYESMGIDRLEEILPDWYILLADIEPGFQGLTSPDSKRILLDISGNTPGSERISNVESGQHLVAHELGHAIDIEYLEDADRVRFRELAGIDQTVIWNAGFDEDGRAVNDYASGAGAFAETFAQIFGPSESNATVGHREVSPELREFVLSFVPSATDSE